VLTAFLAAVLVYFMVTYRGAQAARQSANADE
jgi:hypothetical protein